MPGVADVLSRFRQLSREYEGDRVTARDRGVSAELRRVYIDSLAGALDEAASALTAAGADPQAHAIYGELMTAWAEASPMTSAELAMTEALGPADVQVGIAWESVLGHYLSRMHATWDGLSLGADERAGLESRVLVAMRRGFVTVRQRPDGVRMDAIRQPELVRAYRDLIAMLSGELGRLRLGRRQRTLRDKSLEYPFPERLPDLDALVRDHFSGTMDVSQVPDTEREWVRLGILAAVNLEDKNGVALPVPRDTVWPVPLQIRSPGESGTGASYLVRYELVFDGAGNVRAERLDRVEGEARSLPEGAGGPADFAERDLVGKQQALVEQFGISSMANNTGEWQEPDLSQIRSAFARVPVEALRQILAGVALIRDQEPPEPPGATRKEVGFAHMVAMQALGCARPEPYPATPHIHYSAEVFGKAATSAVGAPGDSGPGGDSTLLHEIAHLIADREVATARTLLDAANERLQTAQNDAEKSRGASWKGMSASTRKTATTWYNSKEAALGALQRLLDASNSFMIAEDEDQRLDLAKLQLQLEDLAARVDAVDRALTVLGEWERTLTGAEGVPGAMADAAGRCREALAASAAAAQRQMQLLRAFARRALEWHYEPCTDYAWASVGEWFAETYSLFFNDPHLLWEMNWQMAAWFERGRPLDER